MTSNDHSCGPVRRAYDISHQHHHSPLTCTPHSAQAQRSAGTHRICTRHNSHTLLTPKERTRHSMRAKQEAKTARVSSQAVHANLHAHDRTAERSTCMCPSPQKSQAPVPRSPVPWRASRASRNDFSQPPRHAECHCCLHADGSCSSAPASGSIAFQSRF